LESTPTFAKAKRQIVFRLFKDRPEILIKQELIEAPATALDFVKRLEKPKRFYALNEPQI